MPCSSAREQEWSLEQSSQLNDAYRTLKDPITRTEYLLRLQGVQSGGAVDRRRRKRRGAPGSAKKQIVPPDLLEQVFELNMQLEEARMNKKMGEPDRTPGARAAATPGNSCRRKYDGMMQELHTAWNEWDALVDRADDGGNVLEDDRMAVRDKLLEVLNRRKYCGICCGM